ncbi:MAG: HD domain-containing protein [Spirochaetes bacterium]|nr:HD domain-containing protein [Spirochaetota bacterium]
MRTVDIDEIKIGTPLPVYILFDDYFIVMSKYLTPRPQDIEMIARFSLSPLYGRSLTEREAQDEPPKETKSRTATLPSQEEARPRSEKERDVYGILISYLTSLLKECRNKKIPIQIIRKIAVLTVEFALKKREEALIAVARGKDGDRMSMHLLNTGILAAILASSLNIVGNQLVDTVCGALMHDIGIPLFNANEPLKGIETHTVVGGNYLKEIEGCPPTVFMPAFQHHEKADGSGYPAGLTTSDTAFASQIVSLCDSCDSHTSYIRMGEDISLHMKKEELFIWKKEDFEPRLFSALTQEILKTFEEGRRVLLNNGKEGVIKKTMPRFPVSPVIMPVSDSTPAAPVELLKTGDIWIERFL